MGEDWKALSDASQGNEKVIERRIDILAEINLEVNDPLCKTCKHCGEGCNAAPDSKVRGCQDYEIKLSDIFRVVEVNSVNAQSICTNCLMEDNCALPKEPNEIVDQCCYFTPKLGDRTLEHIEDKAIGKAAMKPKICQSCMYKGRSCLPNHADDCSEWRQKEEPDTEAKKTYDQVNHPPHYTHGGIECIKCIEAAMKPEGFQDYCKGNVIKYLHRWREKGGVQDLKKAEVYLKWLIESAEKGKIS